MTYNCCAAQFVTQEIRGALSKKGTSEGVLCFVLKNIRTGVIIDLRNSLLTDLFGQLSFLLCLVSFLSDRVKPLVFTAIGACHIEGAIFS